MTKVYQLLGVFDILSVAISASGRDCNFLFFFFLARRVMSVTIKQTGNPD